MKGSIYREYGMHVTYVHEPSLCPKGNETMSHPETCYCWRCASAGVRRAVDWSQNDRAASIVILSMAMDLAMQLRFGNITEAYINVALIRSRMQLEREMK